LLRGDYRSCLGFSPMATIPPHQLTAGCNSEMRPNNRLQSTAAEAAR
jgi:hypothetical protein